MNGKTSALVATMALYRAKQPADRDRAWSNACFANSICTKRQFLT